MKYFLFREPAHNGDWDPNGDGGHMEQVIADPQVTIEAGVGRGAPNGPSGLNTEAFHALEEVQKQMFPGTVLLPAISTGGTDMRALRARGMQCYGIGTEAPQEDLESHAAHGDNERVKETAVYDFVRYMYEVTRRLAAKN